jgi:hypothetical protein
MPFGLKNAGATYQRMMQKCLGSQIGRNIQVYIDNVVITMKKEESLISDLAETFDNLNRYKLKLKPDKVFFWGICRATPQVPGICKRNRGKPREDPGNTNDGETNKIARRTKARRTRCGSKSICGTARRKSTPLLCTDEKIRR